MVAPTGFALEEERDAKRVYKKPKPDEPAAPGKNYITPSGLQRLHDELQFLLTRERRAVTEVVTWAASNGDRSENADYQYGKRRLRQIDGRIRFLRKRIEAAEVVDPETPRAGQAATRAFFGATVRYANGAGEGRVVSIVGTDEVDLDRMDSVKSHRPRLEIFREPLWRLDCGKQNRCDFEDMYTAKNAIE
jgi:transcription elongation factor GreB